MDFPIPVWVINVSSVVTEKCMRPGERAQICGCLSCPHGPCEILWRDILVFLRREGLLPLQRQNLPFFPLPREREADPTRLSPAETGEEEAKAPDVIAQGL